MFFSLPPGYIKKQFTCKNCDKKFDSGKDYQKHIEKDHNVDGTLKETVEKWSWSCDQCGRDFLNRVGWLTHYKFKHPEFSLEQNQSEKSFMCELCSRFFESDKKLRRHITETHGKRSPKAKYPFILRNCPHCDRTFSRISR